MNSKLTLSSIVLAGLMGASLPSSANVYDFYYAGNKVAELTATGGTNFSFAFLSALDSSAFINDLLLDMGSGAFTNTTAEAITTPVYSFSAGGYEGTGMQTKISFPTPNTSARFTIGETSTWTINGEFNGGARVHINAFIDGESIKLVSSVPEPEAYAMALAALGVVGVFGRLRRRHT